MAVSLRIEMALKAVDNVVDLREPRLGQQMCGCLRTGSASAQEYDGLLGAKPASDVAYKAVVASSLWPTSPLDEAGLVHCRYSNERPFGLGSTIDENRIVARFEEFVSFGWGEVSCVRHGGKSMDARRYRVIVTDFQNETSDTSTKLRYRLLAGPDTAAFCERVSDALDDGYVLYGSPAITFDGTTTYVAQAVVLDPSTDA